MKRKQITLISLFLLLVLASYTTIKDPLPSWNNTSVKKRIIDYVENRVSKIPVEDRIAVFDMDGTIACEHPLWFEIAVSSQKMADKLKMNPALDSLVEYQYAKRLSENPNDTVVANNWIVNGVNYIDSINLKAFEGEDYESYVKYANNYLNTKVAPKFGKVYADLFYQPALELIEYLQKNHFQVYIVSGSMQGVIWAVCPQNIGFDRQHLIGTCQTLKVVHPKDGEAKFIIQKSINKPMNNNDGKSMNIFSRLGKVPVVAVGNSTGDFGMFHLASTSKYPNMAIMVNHDDAKREYAYPPYYTAVGPNWQDSLKINGWIRADMSKEFKIVWKKKK